MNDFPDTFFRGCREPKYLQRPESPETIAQNCPLMSMVAFFPDERTFCAQDNTVQTSIVWNDEHPESLKRYASLEYARSDHGGIRYGIGKINRVGAEKLITDHNLSDHVSFDRSSTDENEYHGNIRFDADYCMRITEQGNRRLNTPNVRKICSCFVMNGNQVDFYTIDKLESMFPELTNNIKSISETT